MGGEDRDKAAEARRARLAEQLRANLRRRKAQTRARAAAAPDPRPEDAGAEGETDER